MTKHTTLILRNGKKMNVFSIIHSFASHAFLPPSLQRSPFPEGMPLAREKESLPKRLMGKGSPMGIIHSFAKGIPSGHYAFFNYSFLHYVFLILLFKWGSYGLLAQSSPAFHYQIEALGNQKGLNSSDVFALHQDRDGFIWVGTNLGLSRFDSHRFQNFTKVDNQPLGKVYSIEEDSSGTLWIGGLNGLFFYENGQLQATPLKQYSIQALHIGKNNELWLGGLDFIPFALTASDLLKLKAHQIPKPRPIIGPKEWRKKIGNLRVYDIDTDNKGQVWLGLDNRRASFDGKKLHLYWGDSIVIHKYRTVTAFHSDSVFWGSERTPLIFQKNKQFYPITKEGIYDVFVSDSSIYLLTFNQLLELKNSQWDTLHTFSTYKNLFFQRMILDKEGNFWIAAVGNLLKLTPNYFQAWPKPKYPLYCMAILPKQDIQIGSNKGSILELKNNDFQFLSRFDIPMRATVNAIYPDENGWVWYGTSMAGIILERNGQRKRYTMKDGLADNGHILFYKNKKGELWSGGDGGIMRINIGENGNLSFDNFMAKIAKGDYPVFSAISENPNGTIWAASNKGLFTIKNNQLERWAFPEPILPYPVITALGLDDNQHLWLSTQGEGLWQCRFSEQNEPKLIRQWLTQDGLLSDVVLSLHIDKNNRIWAASQQGICCLDIRTTESKIECFDQRDAWLDAPTSQLQLYESQEGLLWTVGLNGITAFPLYDLPKNRVQPQPFITQIQLFDGKEDIYQYAHNEVMNNQLPQQLVLPYNKNFLRFHFTATSHTRPEKNSFRYQLEGLDPNWQEAINEREVLYSGLQPNRYTFKVVAANNDGVWSDKVAHFSFEVLHPWWKTYWAYFFYFLLIALLVAFFIRQFMQRERMKNRLELEQLERKKIQEIDQLRARFFANISHEFRTPLTLIKAPLEDLLSSRKDDAARLAFYNMHKNTERLLDLVNQLLDLSKLEAGMLQLHAEVGDINAFLRQLAGHFQSLAEQKQLDFQINVSNKPLFLEYDKNKLEKMVLNLLSNAIKFAPIKGWVKIEAKWTTDLKGFKNLTGLNNAFYLKIGNSGEPIPAEEQPKLFERFYQAGDTRHQGTGIGLALVRELVELHKGKVGLESDAAKGTWFWLVLPLKKAVAVLDNGNKGIPKFSALQGQLDTSIAYPNLEENGQSAPLNAPLLLLVEDHEEVRTYIKNKLQAHFQIIEAEDGKIGLAKATERLPDLIISDLMMPQMDGISLCQAIKKDHRTDHIPFILLTAKADVDSRIEGLKIGADDYLAKPFNSQELLVRANNLITQRQKLQERFQQAIKIGPNVVEANSAEQQFLEKAIQVVEDNMDNEGFSVEDFAKNLLLSRTQLHRKLKNITGQSASEFIRNLRLQRAAQLLKGEVDNVTQIAFMVGFNSQSYFSKCFRKKYGCTPSDYNKK